MKNQVKDLTFPDLNTYYKITEQNSMALAYKYIEQLNKEHRNTHIDAQIIFKQRCKITQGENSSLSNKWCWENWTSTCKRIKLDPFTFLINKINSKQSKYPNIRLNTMKITEEKLGRLHDRFYNILI